MKITNYFIKKIRYKTENNKITIDIDAFLVPTVQELNNLLYKYHTQTSHGIYKELKSKFYENKIGFKGFDIILEKYVNNCQVYIQTSRAIHRQNPIISINTDGPDYKYVFDITYLNADMEEAFGVKYLMSIIDAFSRKSMIYGTNTKKAEVLLNFVKEFCIYNNILKVFASDNGEEFNAIFSNFCEDNNIEFRHGAPYNPHSNGIVERFKYMIKKYLSKEYISDGGNLFRF